jgi:hypothetical protein
MSWSSKSNTKNTLQGGEAEERRTSWSTVHSEYQKAGIPPVCLRAGHHLPQLDDVGVGELLQNVQLTHGSDRYTILGTAGNSAEG